MDLMDFGDMGSGCEENNCGLAPGFPEDCSNQECHWEESVFGLIELVCVTVIYIPLMLFGLLGNILTILVVWLRPHMRSSTYLYLSSMAVSDLLILLLLPLDLYKLWRPRPWLLGDLVCKLTMFLSECCTFSTILHITFLSLERYLAVCWPITAKTVVTRRRTRTVIGCLWLGAAVSAAPVLVMVGVEEVGGEELGLGPWLEGEQGGFMIGGGERGSGDMGLMDGRLEGMKWGEKEAKGWAERDGEMKWFGDNRGSKTGDVIGKRDGGEKQENEEGKVELKGEQRNKKKEDEGGGWERSVDGGRAGEIDKRECRCTHYAASSGLLSAMIILSSLYFLIPLCILGLVYSLIGRALCLRPQSGRRDQSHRHIVKMLGVIVLAFVLCWLPFHIGRTIFSFSHDADGQETYVDTNPDTSTLSDVSTDTHTVTKPFLHSDSDTHFSEISSQTGKLQTLRERDEMVCDNCAKTNVEISTLTDDDDDDDDDDAGKDKHSRAISHTSTNNLDPGVETNTHKEAHNDSAHFNTQLGNTSTRNINPQNVRPNPTSPHTYAATPTDLYSGNDTYSNPDTHRYFMYWLSQYFNLVSSVLFYLSAAINPLLYNLMSARYRHAVRSLVHGCSQTQNDRTPTLTVRHSSTTL